MATHKFDPLIAADEIIMLLSPSVYDRSADTIMLPRREAIAALALIQGLKGILEQEAAKYLKH